MRGRGAGKETDEEREERASSWSELELARARVVRGEDDPDMIDCREIEPKISSESLAKGELWMLTVGAVITTTEGGLS